VKHLYTLTGNLLAETTVTHSRVEVGRTHRAVGETFQVGGKGINVAKMAQRLGTFSTAICFPGGHTGNRCLVWLEGQDFEVRGFRQAAETRAGWVVRAAGKETTFLGRDRVVEEEPWLKAIRYLEAEIGDGDMLAVCGSIPGWRPALAEPLGRLLHKMAGRVFVAVDTYGAPLFDLIQAPVDLVKINQDELRGLRPDEAPETSVEQILRAVSRQSPQVRRWVVSGGGGKVVAVETGGEWMEYGPPMVKVVSTVGCGDVLLAALLDGLVGKELSLDEALRRSLPLAAANAASPGVAEFDLNLDQVS